MKQQLKPRGRPWPKGVSGNPSGRPPGSRHKTTLAVLEGIRRAEEELNRPITLDRTQHYEVWSDSFVQNGMRFKKDTLMRVNPGGPIPAQPERLDIREHRQEVMWEGRRYWSQRGWLFDPATRLKVKNLNK